MTDAVPIARTPLRLFALASALACFALGLITLYSSGVGLIDPKLHRAFGFGFALVVAVAVSQRRRVAKGPAMPVERSRTRKPSKAGVMGRSSWLPPIIDGTAPIRTRRISAAAPLAKTGADLGVLPLVQREAGQGEQAEER